MNLDRAESSVPAALRAAARKRNISAVNEKE
jgi:hypothetical protein